MPVNDAAPGAPGSVAAIMAAIRHEVTAPRAAVPPAPAAGPSESAAGPDTGPNAGRAGALPGLPRELDAEVRALLVPLLRDWLDAHLPEIVEAATRSEIRRLTGLND